MTSSNALPEGRLWASFLKLGAIAGAVSVSVAQLGFGIFSSATGLAWALFFLLFEIPVVGFLGAVAGTIVGFSVQGLNVKRLPRAAQVAALAGLGFGASALVMTVFGLLSATGGALLYPVPVTGLIGAIAFTPFGLDILSGRRILIGAACCEACARFGN